MNKPKCLSTMDLNTMQIILKGGKNWSRTEVIEMVRWAVYQEMKAHVAMRNNLSFNTPETIDDALEQVDTLEDKMSEMEGEYEKQIEALKAEYEDKIQKLKEAAEITL
jgi:LPS O-antigen subunit length determinant protein (WzzB/FepE family)